MTRKSKSNKENSAVTAAKITAIAAVLVAIIALGTPFAERMASTLFPTTTNIASPTSTLQPAETRTFTPVSTFTVQPTTTDTLTPAPTAIPITETSSASPTSDLACIGWEFNTNGDREGWQVNLRVNNLRAVDGALRGEFNRFDPSILSPQNLNIDTSKYTVLAIGYDISADEINGQVMWNPENNKNFIGERHMLYGLLTNSGWQTINIDLTDDADWISTPVVNTLRIDPVHNATSGTFAYDYIRLCP